MRAPSILCFATVSVLAVSGPTLAGDIRGESHIATEAGLKDFSTHYGSMPGGGNMNTQPSTVAAATNASFRTAQRHIEVTAHSGRPHPTMVTGVVERYGSLPGGVVLEGSATGLDNIASVRYDASKQALVLGDNLSFKPEASIGEIAQLARALAEDDRIGVSITTESVIAYGAIPEETNLARDLAVADAFMVDFIVPPREWTTGYRMAGGFEPVTVNTDDEIVAFYNFHDFAFDVRDKQLVMASAKADVYVVPVLGERAEDGGYLPDLDALNSGDTENAVSEIKKNADHIAGNINYYMGERAARRAIAYGETAAVLRHLKNKGVDLSALADEIEGGQPESADADWGSLEAAWTTYVSEIQTANDYANWPAPPLDLYVSQSASRKEAAVITPQP